MDTDKTLNYLKKFKKLPTYQFERRIDAFLIPYLENALNKLLKIDSNDLVLVYPEFPLQRLSNINPEKSEVDRLSEYADYLLWSPKQKTIYLVELKTETKSIYEKQFKNYQSNCELNWDSLLRYYFDKINKQNWKKFVFGLLHINSQAPELMGIPDLNLRIEKYLEKNKSKGVFIEIESIRKQISTKDELRIKFCYIAPSSAKNKLDTFVLKNNSNDSYKGLVSLAAFAEYTDDPLKTLLTEIDKESQNCL